MQVAVNGAHVLEYKHRLELRLVDTLSITGKVSVTAVGVVPRAVSPSLRIRFVPRMKHDQFCC